MGKCLVCNEQEAEAEDRLCEGCLDMVCYGGNNAVWAVEKLVSRIAELEAEVAKWREESALRWQTIKAASDTIRELEVKLAYYQQTEEAILREVDRKAERIAELEAEKKAQSNYIERLEAMLTPEQLFDAAN